MQFLELPVGDIAYFILRLVLSGLAAAAAVASFHYARDAHRDGTEWRLAGGGCVLLTAAGFLSAYDAIDNVLLRPHDPIGLASWAWFFLFDLLLPIWALLLISAWRERDRALAELSRLSVTDQLTGALNRRGFLNRAVPAIAQARRSGQPSAVVTFDIDHFKAINDDYGHAAGDDVLRGLVNVLSAGMRPGDLLGRFGGEEFVVFLHDSTGVAAVSIAQRLSVQVRIGVAGRWANTDQSPAYNLRLEAPHGKPEPWPGAVPCGTLPAMQFGNGCRDRATYADAVLHRRASGGVTENENR